VGAQAVARMMALMNADEVGLSDPRVDLCCREAGMAEDRLDVSHVGF